MLLAANIDTLPALGKVSSDTSKEKVSGGNNHSDSDPNKNSNSENDYKEIILSSKQKVSVLINTVFFNKEGQESFSDLDATQPTRAQTFEGNLWKRKSRIMKKLKKSHFKANQEASKSIGYVQIDHQRRRNPLIRSNKVGLGQAHFKVEKRKYNSISISYRCDRSQNQLEINNVVNFEEEEESDTANLRNLMPYLEPSHEKGVFEPPIRFILN